MKKLFLIISLFTFFADTGYSQKDSNFHKFSIRICAPEFNAPFANKYYGTGYGIFGAGISYHFNSKFSIEIRTVYDTLPMIDPKDLFSNPNATWDPGPPPVYYNSPYFSFSGGSLKFLTMGVDFRYDFLRKRHLHIYGSAGLSFVSIKSKAITASDVLIRSNAPVYTAYPSFTIGALGSNINLGGAYYLGKHFDIFMESGYQVLLFNKAAKYLVSPGTFNLFHVCLGVGYSFL